MQQLILGTAQWGLDYGITNTEGRLADEAVRALADTARGLGIDVLDTAPGYGDAEERIGTLAPGFRVQTKVAGAQGEVLDSIRRSATLLGRTTDRVLVHDWHALDSGARATVVADLSQARAEGLVGMIGVSGYVEEDLSSALDAFDRLDVAQVPVSVLDQRLVGSRAVARLREQGGLLQARSVYLQGLALADPDMTPLAQHPDVARLRDACARAHVGRAAACRAFIRGLGWVDEVVVGAASAAELAEWGDGETVDVRLDWASLASEDEAVIDPRRWAATA